MIKTEIYKLDRIEDGIAAIETPNGRIEHQKAEVLPKGAKSGDCFTFENGRFIPAKTETEKRRKLISSLLDEIIAEK
ncbi:MAG: DUF3006 domain-containing protein [Oscillospiraceae bacterium]|nr:DUF3006 domain-containing protein [Oscillospiraceae bacterium]